MRAFLALLPLAGLALATVAKEGTPAGDVNLPVVDEAAKNIPVVKEEAADVTQEKGTEEKKTTEEKKIPETVDNTQTTEKRGKCNCSIPSPICIQSVEGACKCMYAWKLACYKENPKACPKPEECGGEDDKCKCPLDKCSYKTGKEKCKCEYALKLECSKVSKQCPAPTDNCGGDDDQCLCPLDKCKNKTGIEKCKCEYALKLECAKVSKKCTAPAECEDDSQCKCPLDKCKNKTGLEKCKCEYALKLECSKVSKKCTAPAECEDNSQCKCTLDKCKDKTGLEKCKCEYSQKLVCYKMYVGCPYPTDDCENDKCKCPLDSCKDKTGKEKCKCEFALKTKCAKTQKDCKPPTDTCDDDKCKCPLDKCKDKKGKEKCECEHALKAKCAKEQDTCQTPDYDCDDDKCKCSIPSPICIQTVEGACKCMYGWRLACHKENPKGCPKPKKCDGDDSDDDSDDDGKCKCPLDKCKGKKGNEKCECEFALKSKCAKEQKDCKKPINTCDDDSDDDSDDDDGSCNCPHPRDCDDIRDPVKRCHCFNRRRAEWWHKKGGCGQPPIERCDRYDPGECPDQEVNCRSIRDPYLRCKCRNQRRREWWARNGSCRPPAFERCEKFDDRDDQCRCGPSNCPQTGPWACFCKAQHAFECWFKNGMKCRRPVVDVCAWDPTDRDYTNVCKCEPSNCPKYGPHKCFCEAVHKIKCWEKCGRKCQKPKVSFCSYDPPSDKGFYERVPNYSTVPVIPGKKLVCSKVKRDPTVIPDDPPCVKCQDSGKDCERDGWCRECEKDGWCNVCRDGKCRPPKYNDNDNRECRDGRCRECFGGWCKRCSRGVCKICNRDGECKICRDGWCKPIHRPDDSDSDDDIPTPPTTPYKKCGGRTVNGFIKCDRGFSCISDPFASCGIESDCFGICIPNNVPTCGGFVGKQCPSKFKCVPDTRDSDNCVYGKDPDCQGICVHERRFK